MSELLRLNFSKMGNVWRWSLLCVPPAVCHLAQTLIIQIAPSFIVKLPWLEKTGCRATSDGLVCWVISQEYIKITPQIWSSLSSHKEKQPRWMIHANHCILVSKTRLTTCQMHTSSLVTAPNVVSIFSSLINSSLFEVMTTASEIEFFSHTLSTLSLSGLHHRYLGPLNNN